MSGKVIIKKSTANKKKIIIEEKHNLKVLHDSKDNIDKIVHISDIHIYLPIDNSRHDEYMYVFNKLYEEIEELCKNHKILICITGDLCDKNKLWGREIDFVEKFLTKLCSYAPVITIPGNHDYNYCEQDELVHIAPIMRNKNLNNNFYLLIENGLYKYNNLIFGLTAVYSDKVVPCEINTLGTNIKKIGLYHGHVYSRKIKGIVPEKGYFRVEDFYGYDMVLLGDIHTACSLSDDQSRWYAGSLIKQRINEPKDHGYILWDVKSNKGELKPIQNIYTTVMLEIDENGIKDLDKIEIPVNGKVEAIYKNIDFSQAKEKLKELELRAGINIEPHMDMEIKLGNHGNENRIIKNISDLRTKEGISKVIIDYIKGRGAENDQRDLEYMEKIINNIIKDIVYNPDVKQKNIKIKTLKFDNFFSYGEGNVIDFEKLSDSIVNIYGRNSVGKTSIFDAILLSIYGDCTRGKAIDSINTKKKYMSTEIVLNVNDDTFRIVRRRTKKYEYINKKTGKKILNKNLDGQEKTDLKVEIYKNNKLLESNKTADIDDYINENIGKKDDFVKMCMMLQKDNYNFFDMADSEQVNFIMKFINLDIINIVGDTIRCKINDLTREENNVLKEHSAKKLDQLKNILQIRKNKLVDGQKELDETREILTNTVANHMLITDKLANLNIELLNYKNQDDKLLDSNNYNINKKEYKKKTKELSLTNKQIEKLNTEKKLLDSKLKDLITNIHALGNMDEQYTLFCKKREEDIQDINSKICELHEQKSNISIKTVHNNLGNENDTKNINTKISSAKKELTMLEKKRNSANIAIKKLENKIVDINGEEYAKCVKNELMYEKTVNENNDLIKQYDILQNSLLNYTNIDIFNKLNFNVKCKCCKANRDSINYDIILENHNKLHSQAEIIKNKISENNAIIENAKELHNLFMDLDRQKILNEESKMEIEILAKDKNIFEAKIELSKKEIGDLELAVENIRVNTLSQKKIDTINKNIKNMQTKLAQVKESKLDKHDVYLKLCEDKTKLSTSVNNINNNILEKNNFGELLKEEIRLLQIAVNEYEELIEKNDKYMQIRDHIIQMNDQISDLSDKKKVCEDTIHNLEITIHENDCTVLENDVKKLDIIQYDKTIYNKINMYLVKDVNGIRSSILENKIFPHLEEIINSFLTQIVDYKIKFRYLGSQKLEIKKKYVNGSDVSLDTRSASEDTVLDIIFRISLAYFNNVIKCNFFIMDEVFSLFDQQRLDIVLTKIFACLKKYFDVLLIVSQLPEVQTACDNKIIVERDEEGFSRLKNMYGLTKN